MRNKMSDVRNLLIETMENLLDKDNDFDVNKAKAIAQIGNVLVKSAKAEVDFLRVTGSTSEGTGFIETEENQKKLPG